MPVKEFDQSEVSKHNVVYVTTHQELLPSYHTAQALCQLFSCDNRTSGCSLTDCGCQKLCIYADFLQIGVRDDCIFTVEIVDADNSEPDQCFPHICDTWALVQIY